MAADLGNKVDLDVVSQAVTAWFRFYELDPDEQSIEILARAAGELYVFGYHSADDLATSLIGTYIGRWSLMVNAPTSASVH
ncbi:hypothetical protein [Rhizobium leguminosarum]|uniref:hypothetical protein n=1 Tax=Rhizobium leguminosarum TaxID=384 RepID=UPI001031BE2E|nr:hypothetical protein [Rhizobium leguminosarum]TAX87418.1 hypothetical protein ELH95_31660 [Rhizobium leguminosarum]